MYSKLHQSILRGYMVIAAKHNLPKFLRYGKFEWYDGDLKDNA